MRPPYLLLESANFHAGNAELLLTAIKQFGKISYNPRGIKFQIFKFDRIALPDFSWYPVFEKVFFDEATWDAILAEACEHIGDVWIDIFDTYGVEALQRHLATVAGIKLQASVLENHEIISGLSKLDLTGKRLLLNISGHDLSAIERFVSAFRRETAADIALQIGYQAYPTRITDTALHKISILRAAFPDIPLCFADHAPADDPMAARIPLLAAALGCILIEKHICLDRANTEYDHYSAFEPAQMEVLAQELMQTTSAFQGGFIPAVERAYLEKSIQIPIAASALPAGSLVGISDVIYRRTAMLGLTFHEITRLQDCNHSILARELPPGSPILATDFRKASIGAIVACRMKSSRLPKKALAAIAGKPSVERCLANCLLIEEAEKVILATSTEPEDAVLENHLLDGKVLFWRGDPDDVIQRYLDACDAHGIDIIIRVTADCPVVSPEIASLLLKSHFETGADYTAARHYAVGTNSEIYNASALRKIIELLGHADYSEYMTWYMRNNPDVFKLNIVDLPPELVRDYRLTLDYQEDLDMFNCLFEKLDAVRQLPTTKNVFSILDGNPSIHNINSHLHLRYHTDKELIEKLNLMTRIYKHQDSSAHATTT